MPGELRHPTPAVIVAHGYVANLAFMEIPWAADLTRLGAAAFFLDRRGHGRSDGSWWARDGAGYSLGQLEPDLAAGISYLRSLSGVIDPERIAIVGHSDGGTAAITAAASDWDVRAIVALSASVAPWHYVNHVAPRSLLLIYGGEDEFVLNDTDRMLIEAATRGYLIAPGQLGEIADGTARRLLRVNGRGHVDLLYSDRARREALEWLRESLALPGRVQLASARLGWLVCGVIALLALLATGLLSDAARSVGSAYPLACTPLALSSAACRIATLLGVWTAGLVFSAWLANREWGVPTQEGGVFAAVLLGPAVGLMLMGATVSSLRHEVTTLWQQRRTAFAPGDICLGVLWAAAIIVALDLLVTHHYESSFDLRRVALWAGFATLSLPLFVSIEVWLRWLTRALPESPDSVIPAQAGIHPADRKTLKRLDSRFRGNDGTVENTNGWAKPLTRFNGDWLGNASLVMLAALAALMSGILFERMSMVPAYVLGAVMVFYAAHRISRVGHAGGAVIFGSLLMGRVAGAACVFY